MNANIFIVYEERLIVIFASNVDEDAVFRPSPLVFVESDDYFDIVVSRNRADSAAKEVFEVSVAFLRWISM